MTSTHETSTTNGRYEHGLRPEARTVWLDTLTADQERAFEALVGLVDAATKDLPDKAEWGNEPRYDRGLDPKQVSRVLLLGGGRGCGKTTVAQTLQEALDPDLAESIYSRERWPEEEEKVTDRRNRVRDRVKGLSQQIIPLEMLRMNDTPTGTNVLAAVLARIEQLVFPHLTREDVRSTTGDRRQHDAVLDLLRLQTDVAIAWDGNLRERRGNLDPDNYAMEEMRAERVRLQLQDRFQTVLRRTARESLGHKEPAMFLLVVDDVDMDPASLLQLLERLRMVAAPEMLVLLVGDIEPIETAFRMHFAHRYRESTPYISPADIAMAPQEMAAMTNLIARSALRKYVPYHQRVMLQPRLRARDALEVRPLRQGLDVEDIRSMMTEVWVAYPPVPCRVDADKATASTITLHDFVFPEKEAKRGGESAEQQTEADRTSTEETEEDHSKTERYWYVGSRLLADSPRVAVDMWYAVSDARATGSGTGPSRRPDRVDGYGPTRPERNAEQLDPRLHTFVRRLALERVDANSRLWPKEPTTKDWEATQRLLRDGDMTGFPLTAEHDFISRKNQTLRLQRPKPEPGAGDPRYEETVIRWSRHHDLAFRVRGKVATRVDVGPLVLATDLASLEDRAVAERAMASRDEWELAWVCVEQPVEQASLPVPTSTATPEQGPADAGGQSPPNDTSTTAYDGNASAKAASEPHCEGTPWETPRYRTIRQIEQFGYEWNAFLDARPRPDVTPTDAQRARELADAWVVIHTSVLFGDERVVPAGKAFGDDQLETTRQRLLDLIGRAADRISPDDWATEVTTAWVRSVERVLQTVGTDLRQWVGPDRIEADLLSEALDDDTGSG